MALAAAEAPIQGLSVVVLGRFNPSIFSPAWLRMHNLIGDQESRDAEVNLITSGVAAFSTDWLQVTVTEENLVVGTGVSQDDDRLRDVAIGILTVLDQTPIAAIGINREIHWPALSVSAFHALGDLLAPKKFWEDTLILPGTQDLTIQGVRDDLWEGYIRVTVQPSGRVTPGIYARVNDHFGLRALEHQPNSRDEFFSEEYLTKPVQPSSENVGSALAILRDEWDARARVAGEVLNSLIKLSSGLET